MNECISINWNSVISAHLHVPIVCLHGVPPCFGWFCFPPPPISPILERLINTFCVMSFTVCSTGDFSSNGNLLQEASSWLVVESLTKLYVGRGGISPVSTGREETTSLYFDATEESSKEKHNLSPVKEQDNRYR